MNLCSHIKDFQNVYKKRIRNILYNDNDNDYDNDVDNDNDHQWMTFIITVMIFNEEVNSEQ